MHSRGERFIVIDDLLEKEDFAAAAEDFDRTRLKPALSTIDPVFDGFAHRGGSEKQPLADAPDADRTWRSTLKETVAASHSILALDPDATADITFTAWGYPSGSRLSWHNDAGEGRKGAYVLFIHPEWSASWGGGLAVIDEESRPEAPTGAELTHSATHPTLILPRPNRLVIFRARTMHAVLRVDPSAGDRLRKTYTGFITHRPAAAADG